MKKILVVLALAAFASTASAKIENSRHDLSKGYNGNAGKLGSCAYCHAPHLWVNSDLVGTGDSTPPLWNRNTTGATYTIWNTKYTKANPPGVRSLTCLSCHDGLADLGQVNNGAYGSLGNIKAVANVGTDLTNDHPVGMPYDTATSTELVVNPVGVRLRTTAGVIQVECSSCHDPHNTSTGPDGGRFFLRVATDKLCGACHLK